VSDVYGLGDISKLSFLEFIELLQRRLINVRTRKTISDFKGGWYPALLNVYIQYLLRGLLPITDPLHSNGYTFANLYPFLSKYNAFFQKFVDELLPATIILKQGGLLIRNTVFTKQKFMYLRGVNVSTNNRIPLQYLGDDGSVFWIAQNAPAPVPPTLFVNTISGTSAVGAINNTGGNGILNFNLLTQYGMQFRSGTTGTWNQKIFNGALAVNHFSTNLTGLSTNTSYQYRAFVQAGIYGYTGNTLTTTTLAPPIVPSIQTQLASGTGVNSINNTGGINIVEFALIQNYAMEFRTSPAGTWQLYPSMPITGPLGVNSFSMTINGLTPNTTYDYRAYMVVAGLPYRGNIRTTTTQPTPTFVPTVSTGTDSAITTTGFTVNNSAVPDDGGVLVTEYGVLYTQNSFYGTNANLIYSNVPTVGKVSTIVGGITGITSYNNSIGSLSPNTVTYFRAFAKNTVGVGYGVIKTINTLPLPVVNLPLVRTFHGGTGPGQQSQGSIIPSPALSVGQCILLNVDVSQTVFGVGGGQNLSTIYCSTNNGATWSIISPSPFITNSPSSGFPARCCGAFTLPVILHVNERLCYVNQVSSSGTAGTCSTIFLSSVSNSPGFITTYSGSDTLCV
jgi:hypothetical protein